MRIIDARGLACPEPVLLTKKAVDAGEKEFTVLVDDEIPKENIKKFCGGYNCSMDETPDAGGWKLTIRQKEGCAECEIPQEPIKKESNSRVTFLITCNKIGINDELGKILIEGLINTLPSATNKPRLMIFLNEGVHLTTEGSPVLQSLTKLADLGVEIRSCGTCLDYYGLKEKLQVGIITNMYDTVEAMISGDVIIKI
ncbi:MAG: sulfur transfer protein SirA [Pelotomaculum sp. PtaB.Bin104]|nr:MAG: sulfur transfer protein SirA [Pelotomaculum sp. PtaB.Bin104]